jgi:hypothetical protein
MRTRSDQSAFNAFHLSSAWAHTYEQTLGGQSYGNPRDQ